MKENENNKKIVALILIKYKIQEKMQKIKYRVELGQRE